MPEVRPLPREERERRYHVAQAWVAEQRDRLRAELVKLAEYDQYLRTQRANGWPE